MLTELSDWASGLVRAEAQPPRSIVFPMSSPGGPDPRLVPDVDYFRVRVHRIHLRYEREWFETYSPLLLIATEFSYDGQSIVRPAVIGPAMIEQLGRAAPTTFTIADTIVAGPHPLREPRLALTVSLHRVVRGNVVSDFLDTVEGAAKALDLVAGLTPYATLAKVVVNGISALTGGDRPIVARRDEFSPVVPNYYALIAPTAEIDNGPLEVRDGELWQWIGGQPRPFRAADYVLYSVDRAAAADVDVTRLPLHRQWQTVLKEANEAVTPEIWTSAKANLSSLITMAFTSPDLTWGHAEALEQEWVTKAQARRDKARARGEMGGPGRELDGARAHALAALEL